MAKPQINKSTLISLAIHIAIGVALMIFSSTDNILVPSRSDGVEVSLVSMPNQTVEPYTPPVKAQAEPIKTLDTPADINVKPTTAPAPIPKPKAERPKPIEKPTPRPFVQVPDDINPKAVATIKVELYPNLNVKSVKLIKSSGNAMYDQNVQTAIMRVKVFPALPDGANFVDYRILKLTFKPQ